MPSGRKTHKPGLAWLVAAGLLLVQLAALTHEFDHALHKHETPCALHIYSNHLGKSLATNVCLVSPVLAHEAALSPDIAPVPLARVVDYRVRAPPVSS